MAIEDLDKASVEELRQEQKAVESQGLLLEHWSSTLGDIQKHLEQEVKINVRAAGVVARAIHERERPNRQARRSASRKDEPKADA